MPASRESPLRHAARTVRRRMPAEALAAGVGRSKPDVRRAWDSLCEKEGCAIAALFPEDPAKLESASGNIAVLPPEFSRNNYPLRGGVLACSSQGRMERALSRVRARDMGVRLDRPPRASGASRRARHDAAAERLRAP